MIELSFEQMEEIQGGLSWGCIGASVSLALTFAAIAAVATPATGIALALEASAWVASTGGWAYSCAQELNLL